MERKGKASRPSRNPKVREFQSLKSHIEPDSPKNEKKKKEEPLLIQQRMQEHQVLPSFLEMCGSSTPYGASTGTWGWLKGKTEVGKLSDITDLFYLS
uniref:Uncharacterized protein n=1 Tax=Cucumis melo TaxID=3656 RepID=A0A9I9CQH6_CUCME